MGQYYDSSSTADVSWYVCVWGDYDPDGDPFSIYWTDDTDYGTTYWTNYDSRCDGHHSVTYASRERWGFCYTDSFGYYISDDHGNDASGVVTIKACPIA